MATAEFAVQGTLRLFFHGRSLEDQQSLTDCGVQPDCTVLAIVVSAEQQARAARHSTAHPAIVRCFSLLYHTLPHFSRCDL